MNLHFKVLYATYYKKVYSTCLMLLKNHSLAEDATQEAFLKAYKNISSLKDVNKFGGWVASIATRCAIDIYNQNKKNVLLDQQEVMEHFLNAKAVPDDSYEHLEQAELTRELKTAIAQLNPPLNQMVILKYYWQLNDREIAEMLDVPVGTVKSSLFRARQTLAKVLPSINKDYLEFVKEG